MILFKTLGICFLAQFAADSCRDAGESALASKVELAGRSPFLCSPCRCLRILRRRPWADRRIEKGWDVD